MLKPQKLVQLLMALVMMAGLLAPAALVAPVPQERVQAALAAAAADAPDELVRVIVQKADGSSRIEALVEDLGGQVVLDLPIINAFAAELPGRAVQHLGREASVNWVSLDAPVISSGKPTNDPCATDCPPNYYLDTLNVQDVWDLGYDGTGIGVAVIDSGMFIDRDFSVTPGKPQTRVKKNLSFNSDSTADLNGHGTHVAGIIGGNGDASAGFYSGVAPKVNFINLRISDDFGMSYESHTVDALQWVLDNQALYNIRVVNLSINSTVEMSYHQSPMDAAAEILWFNGIVVVASSGNNDPAASFNTINAAPANDPYIIVVGASHEQGTPARTDDTVPVFSGQGTTLDGFAKPDLVAPGKDIISVLSSGSDWYYDYNDRAVLDKEYFRISGTSMAAPMVTGAVALLLQAEPDLTPNQVKYRLMATAGSITNATGQAYPYLDVYAALTTPTTEAANQGVLPHMLLAKMALLAYWASDNGGDTIDWGSVNWDSVNWDSVNWDSVNWDSVNWDSVNWDSVNWDSVNWDSVNWDSVNWDSVNWDSVNWDSVNWDSVNWNSINWNSVDFNN